MHTSCTKSAWLSFGLNLEFRFLWNVTRIVASLQSMYKSLLPADAMWLVLFSPSESVSVCVTSWQNGSYHTHRWTLCSLWSRLRTCGVLWLHPIQMHKTSWSRSTDRQREICVLAKNNVFYIPKTCLVFHISSTKQGNISAEYSQSYVSMVTILT